MSTYTLPRPASRSFGFDMLNDLGLLFVSRPELAQVVDRMAGTCATEVIDEDGVMEPSQALHEASLMDFVLATMIDEATDHVQQKPAIDTPLSEQVAFLAGEVGRFAAAFAALQAQLIAFQKGLEQCHATANAAIGQAREANSLEAIDVHALREMADRLPCTCGEACTGNCVRSSINKMVQALEARRTEA